MGTLKKFEDLLVWQKARALSATVYSITQKNQFAKDFKLRDQVNSATGSIMDNIAEGFGRQGNSEFANFLSISSGSLLEVKSQLYRAMDRSYISIEQFDTLAISITEIERMLHSLIIYLRNSPHRGQKYKHRQ